MMFCIDNCCTDVYFNLAAEEYLLTRKRGDYFMVWQSDPSVVIGKNQSLRAEADEEYMIRKGIRGARRFSGGGAVYHDRGNINLTFIETTASPVFETCLQRTTDFLESIGITAYADERMGIYLDGRKISGSAQCIHKDRMMYHCTLLFSTDLAVLNDVLRGKPSAAAGFPVSGAVRAVSSVHSEVTDICRFLEVSMDIKRFVHLLFHYFLTENEENGIYHFSEEDCAAIEVLKREKYMSEEWIRGRGEKSCVVKNTESP